MERSTVDDVGVEARALRCILGASGAGETTCRLCCRDAGAGAVSLHDEVALRGTADTLVLRDVFTAVAGSVMDSEMLPESICAACTESALASYRFLMLCRESVAVLRRTADALLACRLAPPPPPSKALLVLLERGETRALPAAAADEPRPPPCRDHRRRYQCEDCGRVFSRELPFRRHLTVHAHPHMCSLCTNTYASRSKLAVHVARAHDDKRHACPECPKRFGSSSLAEEHRRAMHTREECRHCGRSFGNKHARRAHELSHGQRWQCPRCPKHFKYKEGLKRHGERCGGSRERERFVCDHCGRSYSNKGTLVQHMRYAHGDDPFACEVCARKFLDRGKLECHRSQHTGVKRYPCDACGARFSYSTTLTYHVRAFHTGDRPYPCVSCGQRFITSSARLVHARRYHGAPAPTCAQCGASFVTRSRLARHARKHRRDREGPRQPPPAATEHSSWADKPICDIISRAEPN